MASVAKTRVVHGDDDGRVTYQPGETIDESRFSKDQLKELRESGAIESKKAAKKDDEDTKKDEESKKDDEDTKKDEESKKAVTTPSTPAPQK